MAEEIKIQGDSVMFSVEPKERKENEVAQSCLTLCDLMGCNPLSVGFSRQEYWSGLPFPSPLTPNIVPKIVISYICCIELNLKEITMSLAVFPAA